MITNLLDLLTWLGEKGIAIRDLKPDNLLAAGDQNKFPIFLSTAREYNIGLIDLETAVDFKPAPFSQMEQPLIGGTLYYATPTHFLVNRSLQKHFPEPGRIYFLQDWHAALAIFYELVVGDYLFKRSARLLHNSIRTIRQTNGDEGMNARHHFWHSANEELHAKCQEHAAALNTVKAVIPEEFQEWLDRELSLTIETLDRCIAGHVRAQSYFKPEKTNEFLEFSIPKIEKLRNNCQNSRLFPDLPERRRHKLIKFFNELIAQRNAKSLAAGYLRVLRNDSGSITALDLIQMMFLVVRYGMHAE